MSMDNVLGVAAASEGNLKLLLFGLVLSMAIVLWLGSVAANLINRFWWLSYVGAAVIAWTGAVMFFEDPFIAHRALWLSSSFVYTAAALITIGVTAFAHWFHRMRD
jgi:predicted tellurium resistance membrane protein TerC